MKTIPTIPPPSTPALDLLAALDDFIQDHILPVEQDILASYAQQSPPWEVDERIVRLKALARDAGLWNLFLPSRSQLRVAEYALLAECMGTSPLAPEIFNCNAPDTGNMELLEAHGSEAQKERWLEPLLRGEMRSGFCMTEPGVASSDATNINATIEAVGDELVLKGRKWWTTGAGHPDCAFVIFMGVVAPEAPRHKRHSMVLVPLDTAGVSVERLLSVFGDYDAPYGHAELSFDEVRVPREAMIGEPGSGFALAQSRLGPGRIHHCMRLVGMAERALRMAVTRGQSRQAFGEDLLALGGNLERVAQARLDIDQARLLTLSAATAIDEGGNRAAREEIAKIKAVAPRMACRVIDFAIQIHGAAGLSQDFPLANFYAAARALRLADGPDEVHLRSIGRAEARRV